jgi:hypothetical protein
MATVVGILTPVERTTTTKSAGCRGKSTLSGAKFRNHNITLSAWSNNFSSLSEQNPAGDFSRSSPMFA